MDGGSAGNPFSLNHTCQHWANCRAIGTLRLCRRPLASSRTTPGGRKCQWAWSPHRPQELWVWVPSGSGHTAHGPLHALSPAAAEAGRPTPGPGAQPGLLPPVEMAGGRPGEVLSRPSCSLLGPPPVHVGFTLFLGSPALPAPPSHCPALPASFPGNLSKAKSIPAVSR